MKCLDESWLARRGTPQAHSKTNAKGSFTAGPAEHRWRGDQHKGTLGPGERLVWPGLQPE